MARIELAPQILLDFDGIIDHLTAHAVEDPGSRIGDIVESLGILARNPDIGRPVANGKRELVLGEGARGYVALYRHVPTIGTVYVLAIRGQRESGFKSGR